MIVVFQIGIGIFAIVKKGVVKESDLDVIKDDLSKYYKAYPEIWDSMQEKVTCLDISIVFRLNRLYHDYCHSGTVVASPVQTTIRAVELIFQLLVASIPKTMPVIEVMLHCMKTDVDIIW